MNERLAELLGSAKAVRKSTEGNLTEYKKGASSRKYGFEISDEEADALFRLPCHYCGFQRAERFNGIDRVDNALGYVPGNVVPCCAFCNRAKGRFPVADFLNWLGWVRSGSATGGEVHADYSGVKWDEPATAPERQYLTDTVETDLKLGGLTPKEYVRRKVWLEPHEPQPAEVKPRLPKAVPPTVARKPKRIRVLRAHDFKGERRRYGRRA